jgi:glycine/D-amino acid oxidase-like deaminating enzyme
MGLQAEVVVIGGGITGAAAAYYLARTGVQVTLIERHDLNTQASGRNAGGLHGQIQYEPFVELGENWAHSFGPSLALLRESIGLWQSLERELGADLEVNVCGGLIVAETDEQLHALECKAAVDRAHGGRVELLEGDGLRRVAPYVSARMAGGLLCALEGKANPLLAAPALARAARAHGASLLPHTEVREIDSTPSGFRVVTSAGTVECSRVLDCAGAEAGDIAALVGEPFPVERYPIQVYATEAVPPLVRHLLYFAGGLLTLKQAKHGSLLIGGGWPARVGAAGRLAVDVESLGSNLRLAIEVVPQVADADVLRGWPGVCPGLPDQRPVLGELAGVPGFVVAMFPFLGFSAGPVMGRIAAALARGEDPGHDLAPFTPARLAPALASLPRSGPRAAA